jgi:hypothetical protein
MLRRLVLVAWIAGTLAGSAAQAQKATEIFIPIGQSPGLSGKYTTIGEIAAVDTQNHTLTVRDEQGVDHPARLTEESKVWLDRSELAVSNQAAKAADILVGSRCEVMWVYDGQERREEAAWIKIQVEKEE